MTLITFGGEIKVQDGKKITIADIMGEIGSSVLQLRTTMKSEEILGANAVGKFALSNKDGKLNLANVRLGIQSNGVAVEAIWDNKAYTYGSPGIRFSSDIGKGDTSGKVYIQLNNKKPLEPVKPPEPVGQEVPSTVPKPKPVPKPEPLPPINPAPQPGSDPQRRPKPNTNPAPTGDADSNWNINWGDVAIVAAVVIVVACIVAAPFTAGQSLWGLLLV